MTTDIAGGVDIARNVVVESGGTILVTGTITMNGDSALENFGAARYTADGVIDTSLDTDGKVAIAGRSVGDALALQAGKLLVAGSTRVTGDRVFALMRLNTNGSVDTSFGTQGLTTTAFTTAVISAAASRCRRMARSWSAASLRISRIPTSRWRGIRRMARRT